MKEEAIVGCILGTAVGDALGLPYEGVSPRRARRLFKRPDKHHFLFGHGMVSDDTEHTCFVAQALLRGGSDPDAFEKYLARSLRWWLLGLPAGMGLATLKSIIRLWIGFPPSKSGIFSAGNGPAMRSALLGVLYGEHPDELPLFVERSTRLTHTDPKAHYGALTVALAAHCAASHDHTDPNDFLGLLRKYLQDDDADQLLALLQQAVEAATRHVSVGDFAESIGCKRGISGYINHTVPCVIQAWLSFQDNFEKGILEIISAGGDTDTTGAILGAIIGARVGKKGIPANWLNGLVEWPRTITWMERLGKRMARQHQSPTGSVPYPVIGCLPRNAFFALVVILHGFRRLLPPY